MNAGKLRDRIVIQQKAVTYNALNEEIPAWSTYATVWAEVMIGSGREYWGAKKLNAELSGIVKIRYLFGVNEAMRIIIDSSYLGDHEAFYKAIFGMALQSNATNTFEILGDVVKYFIPEKILQLFYNGESVIAKVIGAVYNGESTSITIDGTTPENITEIRFVNIYQIAAPPIDVENRHKTIELHVKRVI